MQMNVTPISRRRRSHDDPPHPPQADPHWKNDLPVARDGRYIADERTIMPALAKSPEFAGLLAFDESWREVIALRSPPFATTQAAPFAWASEHTTLLIAWLLAEGFRRPSEQLVEGCIHVVARSNPFHGVRDYLRRLAWDGRPRIDRVLVDYFGARDMEYTRAVGAKFLIAAVARALRPGCKVDTILVLEGKQGAMKSQALRALAGAQNFIDNLAAFGSRDAAHQVVGYWVIELQEIDRQIKGAGASRTKAFATTAIDYFRPAYGRRKVRVPRDSIMCGTTNQSVYFVDATGNRRFWPVRCERIDVDAIVRDRDHLWAEAVERYRRDEQWWLTPAEEALARVEQDARVERHPWIEIIGPYLDKVAAKDKDVSIAEIFESALHGRERTPPAEKAVAAILKAEGWEVSRPRKGNPDRVRRYKKF